MSVTDSYKITEARLRFAELVNRAIYQGARTVLERHGEPVAAIVSIDDYRWLEEHRAPRIDLTSTGRTGTVRRPGEPLAEPQRIAAEYRPGEPPTRPGFRS